MVCEVIYADVWVDPGLFEQFFGYGWSDAVDALKADLDAFIPWEIYSD
jgi:hypothetical protein